MKKISVCIILVSMFIISGCSGSILNAITGKHKKASEAPVKTITVTIDKTTPEEVISVLGKPDIDKNTVRSNETEKYIKYYASDHGYFIITTVCNKNNQCANNGKKTDIAFTFKNNKFVLLWENYHL